MIKIYEKLGNLVKTNRKEKQHTTSSLAEELNVSVGLINNIENGRNDVFKLELFEKLIEELNIDIQEVFKDNFLDINIISDYIEINKDEEITKAINISLKVIIKTYLDTISKYDYNIESIEYISNNLVTTLKTIQNLKTKSPL